MEEEEDDQSMSANRRVRIEIGVPLHEKTKARG